MRPAEGDHRRGALGGIPTPEARLDDAVNTPLAVLKHRAHRVERAQNTLRIAATGLKEPWEVARGAVLVAPHDLLVHEEHHRVVDAHVAKEVSEGLDESEHVPRELLLAGAQVGLRAEGRQKRLKE
jgi:hypothetical protein